MNDCCFRKLKVIPSVNRLHPVIADRNKNKNGDLIDSLFLFLFQLQQHHRPCSRSQSRPRQKSFVVVIGPKTIAALHIYSIFSFNGINEI